MDSHDPSRTHQRGRREETQELGRLKNADADPEVKDEPGHRSGNRPDRRERAVGMRRTRHLRAWYANPHQAESRKEKSTKGTRASTRGSVNRQQGRPRPARHTQGVGGTPRNNSTRRRNERSRGRTAPRKEKPAGCHGSHTKASHPGTITNSRHEAHERRPADAGMDHGEAGQPALPERLPRTRGDEPGSSPTSLAAPE